MIITVDSSGAHMLWNTTFFIRCIYLFDSYLQGLSLSLGLKLKQQRTSSKYTGILDSVLVLAAGIGSGRQ
jgi:hypothetical protein